MTNATDEIEARTLLGLAHLCAERGARNTVTLAELEAETGLPRDYIKPALNALRIKGFVEYRRGVRKTRARFFSGNGYRISDAALHRVALLEDQICHDTRGKSVECVADFEDETPANILTSLGLIGSGGRDRTYDQLINSCISKEKIASHATINNIYKTCSKPIVMNICEHTCTPLSLRFM